MGVFGEGFVRYAQPLIDQTDGSHAQLQKALSIAQLCYNLALRPADQVGKALLDMQPIFGMDEVKFNEFVKSIVAPMIKRHHDMFPHLHDDILSIQPVQTIPTLTAQPKKSATDEAYPGTDRYAPCPCNSGEKYKFCCGAKRR